MVQASLRNNPLLAALLGTAVTGLGHLYLRRWLRAIGWLGVTIVTYVLFVPESTISSINSGTLTDPFSILPIVLISVVSALDAYLIARIERARTGDEETTGDGSPRRDENRAACPACGKDVDPDLGFCSWCATEFADAESPGSSRPDDANTN